MLSCPAVQNQPPWKERFQRRVKSDSRTPERSERIAVQAIYDTRAVGIGCRIGSRPARIRGDAFLIAYPSDQVWMTVRTLESDGIGL